MPIRVTRDVITAIRREAATAHPRECCGILLGEGGVITAVKPGSNVHSAPETHFEIDPQALIDAHRSARQGGAQVAGYYHSHPTTEAVPSAADQAQAAGDGQVWAIFGCGEIRFWRDAPGGFEALLYYFADEE